MKAGEKVEQKAVEEYYTPKRLKSSVKGWRKPKEGRSLCAGFCRFFKTEHCPHAQPPQKGHCEKFVIKATNLIEAQDLIVQDAKRSGIDLL